MPSFVDWAVLEDAARRVQANAYAPYSQYPVGAALLVASGRVFSGANVENASYGLALCAERSCIAQMVASGERAPVAVVVVTKGPKLAAPCGLCRQTLAEFATDMPIRLVLTDASAHAEMHTLQALLPNAFGPAHLAGR